MFAYPLFSNHIYFGHDITFHLNRIVGIADAFRDGQIMPSIYPYTNNGYGYAAPLFYCDLFIYPFAILYILNVPLVICYKIMIVFYAFIGNFLMFICLKKIFKNDGFAIIIGLIFYCFGNYRLIDAFTRSAFSEYLGLTFAPLVILSMYYVLYLKKDKYILLSLSFSLLLFAHNLTFILYCFLYFILLLFFIAENIKNKNAIKKMIITNIKAVFLALIMCSWYLVPMIEQMFSQELFINTTSKLYSIKYGVNPKTFLYPILTIDYVGYTNIIGLPVIITSFIGMREIIKNKNLFKLFIIILFLISAMIGIIPLYKINFLNLIQYSFRWEILLYMLFVILIASIVHKMEKSKGIYLICLMAFFIIYSSFNYQFDLLKDERRIDNFATAETLYDFSNINAKENTLQIGMGEFLPLTYENDYLHDSTAIKKVIDKYGSEDIIYDYKRQFTSLNFKYDSKTNDILMLPLTYYKGYSAYAIKDNKKVRVQCTKIPVYSKLGIETVDGIAEYYVEYTGTFLQHVSLAISMISFVWIIFKVKNERTINNEKENFICQR